MKIKIDTDKVISYAKRHLKPGANEPAQVTFKDISIGDKLSTFVEEGENGELKGTNIYLHFQPE